MLSEGKQFALDNMANQSIHYRLMSLTKDSLQLPEHE